MRVGGVARMPTCPKPILHLNQVPSVIGSAQGESSVFCPQCGKDIADDSQFCPKCGKPITGAIPPPKRDPHVAKYVIGFLSALLLLLVVVNAPNWFAATRSASVVRSSGSIPPSATNSLIPEVHQLTPHSVSAINSAFTVRAAGYDFQKLTVPADSQSVSIDGRFTATGGRGNDIEVYILNEDSFVNFQNGHQSPAFYNSGKVTQANIAANLPGGGTYYVVWNNGFSLLTPKAVQATVTLHYTD
jgi:hypothetical protein